MKCRFCKATLEKEFIDLGNSPPSNSFLTESQISEPEIFYPLRLFICENCFLVQIDEYKKSDEIFSEEYVYFSSFSTTWLKHAKDYASMIVNRLGLHSESLVIEIASNDGYLLQYFLDKKIPCLGIEPAKKTAAVARSMGIDVISEFFGVELAKKLVNDNKRADLLIGNNVLAHVPNINDFVSGLKNLLKPNGVITMEFPHLMKLVSKNQFDTIYHEHYSYFSFHTVKRIFAEHNLDIFDVDELPTHGGSLRIYAKHIEDRSKRISLNVMTLLEKEKSSGMNELSYYQNFQDKADDVKYSLLSLLLEKKKERKKVIAYGAAAKGNTLLNYCGVKKDLLDFVVDRSPYKQNKFLPGSHIPVVSEEKIKTIKPDYILILPWNIQQEIRYELSYIRNWGGKFVVPIPELKIIDP
jgi:2-polyprenyl-3-methyl-5-hydroxy-6-metoxy-1,4-benzoquinol methylase